jgi:hypothetical protein
LHERHPFRDDRERNEGIAEEPAKIVDGFMIDLVDPEAKTVGSTFSNNFTLLRVNPLDDVIELLQKRRIIQFRPQPGDGLAREPTSQIAGVEKLEIAALDFNDQSQLPGELKLSFMVFRSAVNEVADVDGLFFQRLSNVGGAHELRYRLQVDMSIGTARRAVRIASNLERPEGHPERVIDKEASHERVADVQ